MPRRDCPYIPFEVHQIKVQQIYEKLIALGIDRSPEEDWEQARNELEERFWEIRDWRIQKAIEKVLKRFRSVLRGIWKFLTLPLWLFSKLPQLFAHSDTRSCALEKRLLKEFGNF